LFLDLALSLSGLSDKSWAKKQVEFSIKAWLKLRNGVSEEKLGLLNLENLLEAFKSTLTVADIEYAEKLTGCLAAIGESRYREMIGEVIKRQQENERYSQDNSVSSNVANKSADPLSPKSIPVIPTEPDVPLKSERGVDYTNLRDLLATEKWQEADEETAKKMLEVAGRTEEGWLRVEDIDQFPCEDLRTIDQLWVKYSDGRFGFSVQKRIYKSLGGTRQYERALGDRVGWSVNGNWLSMRDVKFNKSAPSGHLPFVRSSIDEDERRVYLGVWGVVCGGGFSSLSSRLVKCNI